VTPKQSNSVQKSKNHPLTAEQKLFNRELSRERIVIENINAKIKTFKIMSERYRNRRKRHPPQNEPRLCDHQQRTRALVAEQVYCKLYRFLNILSVNEYFVKTPIEYRWPIF